jgi:hypothetical protein
MSLAALVGAVAPNLDVEIATIVKKGKLPVAQPGDWLKMSDIDLVRRLNPIKGGACAMGIEAGRIDRRVGEGRRAPSAHRGGGARMWGRNWGS